MPILSDFNPIGGGYFESAFRLRGIAHCSS
jgi:hypothetical protein